MMNNNKMHIEGFLATDSYGDGGFALHKNDGSFEQINIAKEIAKFAKRNSDSCDFYEVFEENENDDFDGLGGTKAIINNANLVIYTADQKCTLEEAQTNVLLKTMGLLDVKLSNYGYSEYTIMGFNINKLTIGGHDLEKEFRSKAGKYVHIVLSV